MRQEEILDKLLGLAWCDHEAGICTGACEILEEIDMTTQTTTTQRARPLRQEWYFTFGAEHYLGNEPLAGRYVKIWGTFEGARLEMFRRFGRIWEAQHPDAEAAGVEKLEELALSE